MTTHSPENDLVTVLKGVGPVSAKQLAMQNIRTVGELASADVSKLLSAKIKSAWTIVETAKNHIKSNVAATETLPSKKEDSRVVVVSESGAVSTTLTKTDPQPVESESKVDIKKQCLVSNHTWWEKQIVLPDPVNVLNSDMESISSHHGSSSLAESETARDQLRQCVIYEMSIESNNRISFLCSWIDAEKDTETLCSMTFTPLYILSFNPEMPKLIVSLTPSDWKSLDHKSTLINTLLECNTVLHFLRASMHH